MSVNGFFKCAVAVALLLSGLSAAYYYVIFLPHVSNKAPGKKVLKGSVIAVNDAERFVVINLGDFAGVRSGQQLVVWRSGRQIGAIPVIETRREISAADIAHLDPGFTIQEGDGVETI